ncbi:type IV pilus modification PilV family protein [Duganella sp. P38]|uniref:type IV pilus modification PilV family protein n=1 Tax=Duganella sp. P38 TaxID=3423949 RepID=UPI003D7B8B6D
MYNKRRQRGVTIIELVMFIVIVGVAAAGILQVMDMTSRTNTDPIRRKQAMLIAEAYMEEIQQAQFTACDPADANALVTLRSSDCASLPERYGNEQNTPRPFDNINDYVPANYVEGTPVRAFAVPGPNGTLVDTDVAGNPLGAGLGSVSLANYVTTLALNSSVNLGNITGSQPQEMTVLQITITVTYGANESVVLQGYRTRYDPRAL